MAAERGVQDALKERLLAANFTEGAAIADHACLRVLATEAGLDGDEVDAVLAGDRFGAEVRADEQRAAALGITATATPAQWPDRPAVAFLAVGLFRKKRGDVGPGGAPAPAATGGTGGADELRQQSADLSALIRNKPFNFKALRDLEKVARSLEADALARMQAAQQGQQPGSTVGSLLAAVGMDWSSDYIKQVRCPSCGAPKRLPSPSAYIYCDYCGALADFDFRTACADQSLKMPGPEYRNLVKAAQPRLQEARAAGDRERYVAAQREIFDGYAANVPKACSHRISDPDYRAQYVEYMAQTTATNDFDEDYSALSEEMVAAARNLAWTGGPMSLRTGGPSFWAMVDVVQRSRARVQQLMEAQGLSELDPDRATDVVRQRMASSLFCQGWLPMLDAADAQRLIEEMHLTGEYTKIEPPADGEARSCGGCGNGLTVLSGATRVICDHCGRALDVGGAGSTCRGCGGHLAFPAGVSRLQCPYCQTDNERVGLT